MHSRNPQTSGGESVHGPPSPATMGALCVLYENTHSSCSVPAHTLWDDAKHDNIVASPGERDGQERGGEESCWFHARRPRSKNELACCRLNLADPGGFYPGCSTSTVERFRPCRDHEGRSGRVVGEGQLKDLQSGVRSIEIVLSARKCSSDPRPTAVPLKCRRCQMSEVYLMCAHTHTCHVVHVKIPGTKG